MGTQSSFNQAEQPPGILSSILQRLAQIVFLLTLKGIILFVAAGDVRWGAAWFYLGLYGLTVVLNSVVLLWLNPALIAERAHLNDEAKAWDRPLAGIVSFYGPLLIMLAAGLDHRFGWTNTLSAQIHWGGAVLFLAGGLLVLWAMATNPFFTGLVHIQKERGHTVASSGPYRLVRHPGYSGMTFYLLAAPLVLGAMGAFIPAILTEVVLVYRTIREDATLQAELPGYREYAQHTRFRLVPGLW